MRRDVTLRSGGRRFAEGGVLTALGLVVSEHVDKLALVSPDDPVPIFE